MAEKVGFEVTTFLGNNGTFYYPKEDLVATGMLLHDSHNLPTADQHERDEINSIRAQLQQVKVAEGRRGPFDLHLDLEIKNRP
jgi:hypothetical protein